MHDGDKVRFTAEDDGRILLARAEHSIRDLFGILGKPRRSATLEDMDEAVRQHAVERYLRSKRMIGLDTNVLARLFVDDDIAQARQAREFVAARCTSETPGFVDRVALCELVWVLASVHDYRRGEIAPIIEKLLSSSDLMLEDKRQFARRCKR